VGLARRLIENSFADRVFFCNSGSEANETALKFARKVGRTVGGNGDGEEKTKIVAFTGSFHGRTMGALAATARAKYREPFAPLVQDVVFAEFNDAEAARAVVDNETCAVIVEPVQGEGGVNPADPGFLRSLRVLCNEHNALLIFDEIQCGMGRTGTLWAHEADGVKPDIMTLAKPLAGGLPIGATLVTEEVAAVMKPGDHGSTFAAGPLVCRAAQVVFDRVQRPGFLAMVRENGAYLLQLLADIKSPLIEEIRGRGLLVGVQLNRPVKPLLAAARERGLLVINAGDTVLRLCPPLIVERPHIDQAVEILKKCLADMEERG
jgi:acetylornithine/succinyldiaminopimelate/putrescine aminotransferase